MITCALCASSRGRCGYPHLGTPCRICGTGRASLLCASLRVTTESVAHVWQMSSPPSGTRIEAPLLSEKLLCVDGLAV
jgi:hypothetical protein